MTVYHGLDTGLIEKAGMAFKKARDLGYVPDVPWVHVERRLHPERRPSQRALATEALQLIRSRSTQWRDFEYVQLGRCLGSAGFYQASFDYLSRYTTCSHEIPSKMESVKNDTRSLLPVLNRFGEAIESLTSQLESEPDDLSARQGRAMLYSRTGQHRLAEQDIQLLPATTQTEFVVFYQLYWQERMQEAHELFDKVLQDDKLPLRFRFWGCSLMGQIEQAIENIEMSASRGAPVFNIRVLLNSALPRDRAVEVEAHPRFQRYLEDNGIDNDWRTELAGFANDVTEITGIHVSSHG
jgi:tetratricopeptide (TPR) repeat protein